MSHFIDFFHQNTHETKEQRNKIHELLKDKELSVSEIASNLNIETPLVLWNLLGMLRWGKVDVLERDHELIFTIKEE